jgi:hypothetical protein
LQRSANGGLCAKGVCSCKSGFSGDDCWIENGQSFKGTLGEKAHEL